MKYLRRAVFLFLLVPVFSTKENFKTWNGESELILL
jgi:hypothetical protein